MTECGLLVTSYNFISYMPIAYEVIFGNSQVIIFASSIII